MKRKYLILLFTVLLLSCERNSDTDVILFKFYGDAYEDIGYSISKSEGGYFITGQLTQVKRDITASGTLIAGSTKKMGIIRTDSEGNVIGKLQLAGGKLPGSGTRVITMADGTAVAAGFVIDTVTSQKDIFIVRLDADGNISSEKIFKSDGNQYSTDIIKTDEGFLLLGTTDVKREPVSEATGNAAGKKDILLLRLDNSFGSISQIPAVGFIGNEEGAAIKQELTGGYMVVGTTDRSDRPSEQAGNNIFLFRVNEDGSTTQPRIVGGTLNETAADFEVLNDGYLIAGTIGTEGGADQRGYIWKMPLNIYDAPEFQGKIDIDLSSDVETSFSINAMCRYKTNSFLLAGQHGTGLSSRMLVLAVDAFGTMMEGHKKIAGGTGTQEVFDVISDEENNVIAVGKNSYENNSMITFMKFRF